MKGKLNYLVVALIIVFISCSLASAATFSSSYSSASSVTYQHRAGFNQYYSSSQINTYWPILGDKETCEGRQDILLQVAPGGCTPMVVRSDLLAEQNVPVFCQISALEINPLLDIKSIDNVVFKGDYPKDVVGAGFHPAQAALRTRDKLLGDPLINNIGYVVVVLKKNPKEDTLPDSVSVNLTANIEYDAENALGVGKAEYTLQPVSDEEWETNKESFWNGRYFVRLIEADSNYAVVALYDGDDVVSTVKVEKGETSRVVYMPGQYCRAGVQVAYEGFTSAQTKARIEVGDDQGTDSFDTYRGSRFLNDRCVVEDIKKDANSDLGNVTIRCSGGGRFTLSLSSRQDNLYSVFVDESGNKKVPVAESDGSYSIDLGNKGVFVLSKDNQLFVKQNGGSLIDKDQYLTGNNNKKSFVDSIELALNAYKKQIAQGSTIGLVNEENLGGAAETKFNEAINEFEYVADNFPSEKLRDNELSMNYGELALRGALELTKHGPALEKKQQTSVRILDKLVQSYPNSQYQRDYSEQLRRIYELDPSKSGKVVEIGNKLKYITLKSVSSPQGGQKSSVDLSMGFGSSASQAFNGIPEGEFVQAKSEQLATTTLDSLQIDKIIDEENVRIKAYCKNLGGNAQTESLSQRYYTLRVGQSATEVCQKAYVQLDGVDLQSVAKIKLIPWAKNAESNTTLNIQIGIEKRNIKLSPEKALDKIEDLNKSIAKWESISKKLANLVKGMKGACFATTALLTAKNFIGGLDGTSLARQEAMGGEYGWTNICKKAIETGEINGRKVSYGTLTQCFNGEKDNIEKDVNARKEVIQAVNKQIEENEKPYKTGSLVGGYDIDNIAAQNKLVEQLKSDPKYSNDPFVKSLEVASKENPAPYSYSDLRDWYANKLLEEKGVTSASFDRKDIESRIKKQRVALDAYQKDKQIGGFPVVAVAQTNARTIETKFYPISTKDGATTIGEMKVEGVTNFGEATFATPIVGAAMKNGDKTESNAGDYLVVGNKMGDNMQETQLYKYKITQDKDGKNVITLTSLDNLKDVPPGYNVAQFKRDNNLLGFKDGVGELGGNRILETDRRVRYFETGPDKGLPAIVPFDVNNGWYVRVKSNLKIGNAIAAYDASGLPKNWWICNVGGNGAIDTVDACQQIVAGVNDGISVLGLSQDKSKKLIADSQKAIMDAANQRGRSVIKINGQDFLQGPPATEADDIQCQNFMSADDCKLMFNVCDPVICPPSRCNLGGAYPVADVIQTGIVGSALLCLPNYKEGVLIPVCLTGIQAGIDNYVSILKSYRDCLQTSVDDGKMVGICDMIYSIYTCEFFWRQIAPVANIILPKLVEFAYGGGQGARGGGEYLTVMGAWENTQKSIEYFTQVYAVNSLKAFNIRSAESVGTEFCKGFISMKNPEAFKSLLEPDSPPQFTAYFDSIPYTSATVPATSHYKVYYHIFAGKDSGAYYNVYLKSPPDSVYYRTTDTIQVSSGFIQKGQYASETKDFTAPEGYKELCVRINDKEECGFKQVSTNFAVNVIADKAVSDEAKNQDVTSESECISGNPNLLSMAQPNLQSGVEDTITPQISDRGIIRVCATNNPGSSTDPGRYVDVGYCGDKNIRCWIDKKSVSNAISDDNNGTRSETMDALKQRQNELMVAEGALPDDQANAALGNFEALVSKFSAKYQDSKSSQQAEKEGEELIAKMNEMFGSDASRILYNHGKARMYLLKAKVKAEIAKTYMNTDPITTSAPTAAEQSNQESGQSEEASSTGFSLGEKYDPKKKINILYNGMSTELYLESGKVLFIEGGREDEVGVIREDTIVLLPTLKDRLIDYYDLLNRGKVTEGSMLIQNEIYEVMSGDGAR